MASSSTPPPIPTRKPNNSKTLDAYNQKLKYQKNLQKKLSQKAKKIDTDINQIKEEMIGLASKIRDTEQKTKNLEQRIIKLEIRKSILEDKLVEDRASIAKLILALERIRRTPPEAMIARPGTPYKTAQSALLMQRIMPSINRHAEKLRKNLETLNKVQTDLEKDKENEKELSKALSKRHESLKTLMSEHKIRYKETNNNLKISEISAQQISIKAKNLSELVKKLKEEEQKEKERQKNSLIKEKKNQSLPTTIGQAQFPVSGIIRTSYNQTEKETGSKSKGITFEGRSGGIVTAPMSGKVSFTGSFKKYGNIVIIEHPEGYHSLIAGISDISAYIGDIVKTGEPIGILPESSLIKHPTLYYELRKNGKPINPSVKFPDLG